MISRNNYYGNYMLIIFSDIMEQAGMKPLNFSLCDPHSSDILEKVRAKVFNHFPNSQNRFVLFWNILNSLTSFENDLPVNFLQEYAGKLQEYRRVPDALKPIIRNWLAEFIPPPVKEFSTLHIDPVLKYIASSMDMKFVTNLGLETCAIAFRPLKDANIESFISDLADTERESFTELLETKNTLKPVIAQKIMLKNGEFAQKKEILFRHVGCSVLAGAVSMHFEKILEDIAYMNPTPENLLLLKKFKSYSFSNLEREDLRCYALQKIEKNQHGFSGN